MCPAHVSILEPDGPATRRPALREPATLAGHRFRLGSSLRPGDRFGDRAVVRSDLLVCDEQDLVARSVGPAFAFARAGRRTRLLSTCRWLRGVRLVPGPTRWVLNGVVAQPARMSMSDPERTGAANGPGFGRFGCLMAVAGSGTVAPEAGLYACCSRKPSVATIARGTSRTRKSPSHPLRPRGTPVTLAQFATAVRQSPRCLREDHRGDPRRAQARPPRQLPHAGDGRERRRPVRRDGGARPAARRGEATPPKRPATCANS